MTNDFMTFATLNILCIFHFMFFSLNWTFTYSVNIFLLLIHKINITQTTNSPQCGFSNTACQILGSFDIDFHSVDVLADEAIRTGVKDFSQWPTIPQLYVCGEFIGGSDIMIEMYQNGELGEMIEKVRTSFLYNNNINKITIGIIRRIANEAVGMEWNERKK